MGLLDACQFANAVAARSCTFVGGTSARSTYDDTMQWLNDSMAQWLDSVSLGE
jgi:sugar/nucleoside kinase (ribokinase family)